jgi:flagellar basal-body rod modification protein FlgD
MPDIGVPNSAVTKNNFANISIGEDRRKTSANANAKETDPGKVFNRLAGASEDLDNKVKIVDGKQHNKMKKDDFLKLLSAQLQNQDPMNPMNQDKFSSELAQYSQLEQLTNINENMQGLNKNMPIENKFFAASFLGKEVLTNGSSLQLAPNASSADFNIRLPEKAQNIVVRIYDQRNQMIRQMDLENLSKGNQTLTWDGVAADGQKATPGDYKVIVQAWNDRFESIPVESKATGTVTGVNFDNGEVVLLVDGNKKVFLRDVDSFNLPGFKDKTQALTHNDKSVGHARGLSKVLQNYQANKSE